MSSTDVLPLMITRQISFKQMREGRRRSDVEFLFDLKKFDVLSQVIRLCFWDPRVENLNDEKKRKSTPSYYLVLSLECDGETTGTWTKSNEIGMVRIWQGLYHRVGTLSRDASHEPPFSWMRESARIENWTRTYPGSRRALTWSNISIPSTKGPTHFIILS